MDAIEPRRRFVIDYSNAKYPLFLDLRGEHVVVVGAGAVAERKIDTLLDYGAAVTVISPETTKHIVALSDSGAIELKKRPYEEGDLAGALLAICAVGIDVVNRRVYAEARERRCLINVVDVPDQCNFIVPSIVRRGPLQIAISTSGAAPTVAKQLRRELEERFGSEWGTYVLLLGDVRTLVMDRVPGDEFVHKPIFSALATANLLERIVAGETLDAEQVYAEIVAPMVGVGGGEQ